ncbi:MAG: Gfo/Idh/MocA family oxidoreductase [Proteobacteria bacterium]|nr:Gfo/Idh/MocA family oxidoreductase [Pseudomonadota bacterium]
MTTSARPRVAVVGTSHWHHKFYRGTIAKDAHVVGYSDPSEAKRKEVEPFYGPIGTGDWRTLLGPELALDGVVVLAPHDEMREVCLAFIERGVPIILEKPGGLTADDVGAIRAAASQRGVPIAVAFIQREGNLWKHLQRVGALDYATFVFHSGPPERYISQSPWALQRKHAGGGSFINLAVHYIDLFLLATQASQLTVQAQAQARLSRPYDVEDRLTALVSTDDGVSAVIECGYIFPASPEVRYLAYSARGSEGFLAIDRSGDIAFTSVKGATDVIHDNVDSGPLTGIFIRDAIAGLRNGFAGMAGIDALHRAMQVVDAAHTSAAEGRAVTTSIAW